MALIDFLERKKELARTIFTEAELKIIQKQTIGLALSQSEKNVLSRSIRKKLQCIKECSIYQEEFLLKKAQGTKRKISDATNYLSKQKGVERIYLFGSFLTHNFNLRSDVDIAVKFRNISVKEATKFLIESSAYISEKIDLSVYNNLPEKIQKEIDENGRCIFENTGKN